MNTELTLRVHVVDLVQSLGMKRKIYQIVKKRVLETGRPTEDIVAEVYDELAAYLDQKFEGPPLAKDAAEAIRTWVWDNGGEEIEGLEPRRRGGTPREPCRETRGEG